MQGGGRGGRGGARQRRLGRRGHPVGREAVDSACNNRRSLLYEVPKHVFNPRHCLPPIADNQRTGGAVGTCVKMTWAAFRTNVSILKERHYETDCRRLCSYEY